MKHLIKRAAALAMAMAMALTLTTWASAADYTDMPSNWAKVPMEAAVENGLLKGDNGRLRPGDSLTRAEMAAILVRAFGADQTADLSKFTDVPAGKWYAKELSSAVFMEIMKGSGSALNPEKAITREEAFAVLARALKLQNGSSATLARFTDGANVSSWFTGEIAAMVEAGFVNGSDGKLNPKANISRQEFAQVMYNIFGVDYIKEAGTYSELGEKSVMINASGVTVKDATIHGDVIIGEGVGEGDVYFDNVTIEGRVVVRGGGVNSIHFTRSTVANVVIAKIVGNVRVVGDRTSTAKIISVADGDAAVVIENLTVTTVDVASADTPVEVRSAVVTTVNVAVAGAEVSLTSNTTVTTVNVAGTAAGSTIKTQTGVTVTTVNAAVNVTVDGGGRVQNVAGTGSVTDTTGKPVTGGSTGGGSIAIGGGGGGTTKPTEPTVTPPSSGENQEDKRKPAGVEESEGKASIPKPAPGSDTLTAENITENPNATDEQKTACANGHTWGQVVTTTAPTCTGTGVGTYTCETCGATGTVTIEALKHSMTKVQITKNPTCTETGVKTTSCANANCQEKTTEDIPALGHAYTTRYGADKTNHWQLCDYCGAANETKDAHTWTDVEGKTTAATCKAAGSKEQSCTCGAKQTVTLPIDPDAHTASEEWSKDKDQHWHNCELCGKPADTKENHSFGENGKTACKCGQAAPTEDGCGIEGCTCADKTTCKTDFSKCDAKCTACTKAKQDACKNHDWEHGVCKLCQKVMTDEEKAACTHAYPAQYSDGKCTKCDTVCGHAEYENGACKACHKPHDSHDYTNQTGSCDICGAAHTDHTYNENKTKEIDGKNYKICDTCGAKGDEVTTPPEVTEP